MTTPKFDSIEKCPRCQEATLAPLRGDGGALLGTRVSVLPLDKAMTTIGGPNFLAGYKLCATCGNTIVVNLTLLGLDKSAKGGR